MKKRTINLILVSIILFTGCKSKQEQNEANNYLVKEDTIYVTDNVLAEKLKLTDTQTYPYSKEVVTAGTIQAIPTQFAYIAPPLSGRVLKSYIKLGQNVQAGTMLFEISSPDFTTTQKDFFQARSTKELAQKDLRRKEDLVRNGVSSQKELEEAQNQWLMAEKDYENAYTALKVYQVDHPEDMVLGQPLVVRSPISGIIIENNIVTGQYLKDDAEPIAIVANLSDVWITAQVKEKDIRFIKEGSDLEIEIPAWPEERIKATVYHIEEAVDETTRSIRVLSICENKKKILKLGMYVTVYFQSDPANFIHIPDKALLQGEKDSYVYVQSAPHTFIRTPVEVEVTQNGWAVISNGLTQGDKVICEGGYYLK